MNQNERTFRKTCGSIGIAMLVFWALITLLSLVLQEISTVFGMLAVPTVTANILFYTVYAVGYLTA